MRGRRLSVEEVKGLDIGTRVVVNRVGEDWADEVEREVVEKTVVIDGLTATIDENGEWDIVNAIYQTKGCGFETEYYEYIEG